MCHTGEEGNGIEEVTPHSTAIVQKTTAVSTQLGHTQLRGRRCSTHLTPLVLVLILVIAVGVAIIVVGVVGRGPVDVVNFTVVRVAVLGIIIISIIVMVDRIEGIRGTGSVKSFLWSCPITIITTGIIVVGGGMR